MSPSVLLLSGLLAGALALPATTLNFTFVGVKSQALIVAGVHQSCSDATGGTEYPLGCQGGLDSDGGHAEASIGGGGSGASATTLSGMYGFEGRAVASLFSQPGADTSKATAGFTFEALLAPEKIGDTFKFKLQDSFTCSNTLGSCNSAPVLVYGAKSINGNLKTGETVTATGPVRLDLDESVSVENSLGVTDWTKRIIASLFITPISETSPKHSHLEESSALVATPEPGTIGLLTLATLALCSSKLLRSKRKAN